jgi:hypothetical protein
VRFARLVNAQPAGGRDCLRVHQVGLLLKRFVQDLNAALRIESVFDSAMWPV